MSKFKDDPGGNAELYKSSCFVLQKEARSKYCNGIASYEVPRCNVKMTPLKYHKILCTPMKLTSLNSYTYYMKTQGYNNIGYCFSFEADLVNRILKSKDPSSGSFGVQVFLRFCLNDPTCIQDDVVPYCIARVNNTVLLEMKDTIHGPLDITHLCNFTEGKDSKNFLSIEWMANCKKRYCLTICVAEKLPIPDIVSNLMKSDESVTRKMVQCQFTFDEDVHCTSLKASLICPLGQSRLIWPCRGSNCSHIQCMDASTLLKMNEAHPTSKKKCFICDKILDDIYIDGLFLSILSSVPQLINAVEFRQDGSWIYENAKHFLSSDPKCEASSQPEIKLEHLDEDTDDPEVNVEHQYDEMDYPEVNVEHLYDEMDGSEANVEHLCDEMNDSKVNVEHLYDEMDDQEVNAEPEVDTEQSNDQFEELEVYFEQPKAKWIQQVKERLIKKNLHDSIASVGVRSLLRQMVEKRSKEPTIENVNEIVVIKNDSDEDNDDDVLTIEPYPHSDTTKNTKESFKSHASILTQTNAIMSSLIKDKIVTNNAEEENLANNDSISIPKNSTEFSLIERMLLIDNDEKENFSSHDKISIPKNSTKSCLIEDKIMIDNTAQQKLESLDRILTPKIPKDFSFPEDIIVIDDDEEENLASHDSILKPNDPGETFSKEDMLDINDTEQQNFESQGSISTPKNSAGSCSKGEMPDINSTVEQSFENISAPKDLIKSSSKEDMPEIIDSDSESHDNVLSLNNPTDSNPKEGMTENNDTLIEVYVNEANETNCDLDHVCAVGSKIFSLAPQSQPLKINITYYWCNFCSFVSEKKEALLLHVKEHQFHCKYCRFNSFSRAAVIHHCTEKHEEFSETASILKYCTYLPDLLMEDEIIYGKKGMKGDNPTAKSAHEDYTGLPMEVEVVTTGYSSGLSRTMMPSTENSLPVISNVVSGQTAVTAALSKPKSSKKQLISLLSTSQTFPSSSIRSSTGAFTKQKISKTQINSSLTTVKTFRFGSTRSTTGASMKQKLSKTQLNSSLSTPQNSASKSTISAKGASTTPEKSNKQLTSLLPTVKTSDSTVRASASTVRTSASTVRTSASTVLTSASTVKTSESTVKTSDSTVKTSDSTVPAATLKSTPSIKAAPFELCWKCKYCGYLTLVQSLLNVHLNDQHPYTEYKYVLVPVLSKEKLDQIKASDAKLADNTSGSNAIKQTDASKFSRELSSNSPIKQAGISKSSRELSSNSPVKQAGISKSSRAISSSASFTSVSNAIPSTTSASPSLEIPDTEIDNSENGAPMRFNIGKSDEKEMIQSCFKCAHCDFIDNTEKKMKIHLSEKHRTEVMYVLDKKADKEKCYIFFCFRSKCAFKTRDADKYWKHFDACIPSSDGEDKKDEHKRMVHKVERTKTFYKKITASGSSFVEDSNVENCLKYACLYCPYDSNNRINLKMHVIKNHVDKNCIKDVQADFDEKKLIYFCTFCFWDTRESDELAEHIAEFQCTNVQTTKLATPTKNLSNDTVQSKEKEQSSSMRQDQEKKLLAQKRKHSDQEKSAKSETLSSEAKICKPNNDNDKIACAASGTQTSILLPNKLIVQKVLSGNTGKWRYECLSCTSPMSFRSFDTLRLHFTSFHKGEEFIYKDYVALQFHQQSTFYMCNYTNCAYISTIQNKYRLHLLGHAKAKIYECCKCKWITEKSDELKIHRANVHKGGGITRFKEIDLLIDSTGKTVKQMKAHIVKF